MYRKAKTYSGEGRARGKQWYLNCGFRAKKKGTKQQLLTCFSEISLARTLDDDRTLIAVSSSRMFPSEEDNTSNILSSISFSCLSDE